MVFNKRSSLIYIILFLVLLAVFGYIYLFFRGQADTSGNSTVPPEEYRLGMMQPMAVIPERVPTTTIKLFDDLNLTDIRYLLYPLPSKNSNNEAVPNPEDSFPRADKFIKFSTARQQNIVLTLYLNQFGKDFDPQCSGSGVEMRCNFDWKNLVPDIIHRLDGDCDFNNDDDCNDVVYGQKEADGPIGKVTTFQIFHRLPGVPLFFGEEGAAIYAAMFKEIATKIKQECPTCKIVFPGMMGGRDDIYPFDMNLESRTIYLKNVLQNLGDDKNLIDIFDIQYRGVNDEPFYAYQRMREFYLRYRQILDQAQLESVPIWMTEVSAYTNSPQKPWNTSLNFIKRSESDQAKGVIREIMFFYALGIRKIFHGPLLDKAQQIIEGEVVDPYKGYLCNSGLLTENDTPKKAFDSVKYLSQKVIPGAQSIILRRDDNIKLIEIKYNNNKKAYVAWNDAGSEEIDLICAITQPIKITNLISNSTEIINKTKITITDEPIFIESNF